MDGFETYDVPQQSPSPEYLSRVQRPREEERVQQKLFDSRVHVDRKDVAREIFDDLKILRWVMVALGVTPFLAIAGMMSGSFLLAGAIAILGLGGGAYYFSIQTKKYRYLGEKYKFLHPQTAVPQSRTI